MELSYFEYYLIGINVIGMLAYGINMFLYAHTEKGQIDALLTILSFLGGSFGILLTILLFDRKPGKENMMSRVFVSCVFIIQLVALLLYKGYHKDTFTFAFWEYFASHEYLLIYLGVINFITFVVYAIDKVNSMTNRSRIRIVSLLGLAFIGGSIGALLAMYLLHHKTRKDYFAVGVPFILAMQVVVLFFAMNVNI